MNINNFNFSFFFITKNLPNGGNTIGNELNGICEIVPEGDVVWPVVELNCVKLKTGSVVVEEAEAWGGTDEGGGTTPDGGGGGTTPDGGTWAKIYASNYKSFFFI